MAALQTKNVSLIIAGTILISLGNSFIFVSVGWLAYEFSNAPTVVVVSIAFSVLYRTEAPVQQPGLR